MKRIACLGDSNTFGYDPASLWGDRYPKGSRWTGRLERIGYDVLNLGQNGLGVARNSLHPVFVRELITQQPLDCVTIMLGSNDLLMGLSARETADHMKKLLSLILSAQAAGKLLLVAPVPFQRGSWVQETAVIQESFLLADQYEELAKDLNIHFANAGKWDIPLAGDGVHFTEEGHRIFADQITTELCKLHS